MGKSENFRILTLSSVTSTIATIAKPAKSADVWAIAFNFAHKD